MWIDEKVGFPAQGGGLYLGTIADDALMPTTYAPLRTSVASFDSGRAVAVKLK